MTRNFNSVQAQYDLAQDKVEELEKQVKVYIFIVSSFGVFS